MKNIMYVASLVLTVSGLLIPVGNVGSVHAELSSEVEERIAAFMKRKRLEVKGKLDVNGRIITPDGESSTLLCELMNTMDEGLVREVLKSGGQVFQVVNGQTAVDLGASLGRPELLEILLSHDSSKINEGTQGGPPPLFRAYDRRTAEVLIDHGADVNKKFQGKNMIEHRAGMIDEDLKKLLIEKGLN